MLAMLGCILSWSTSPLFIKYFAGVVDPWTSNGWRYGAAAIFFLPWTIRAMRRGLMPRRVWGLTLIPAVINSVAASFYTGSLYYDIDPAFSMLCMRLQVVFATLAAVICFADERRVIRSRPFLAGMVMVIVGAGCAIVFDSREIGEVRTHGIWMLVAGAALFGIYGAMARRFLMGVPSIAVFGGVVTWTGLFMVITMILFGDSSGLTVLDIPRGVWLVIIVSGFIGVAVGHGLYFVGISNIGVAMSHGMMEVQPFLVALISYYVFGEVLNGGQWVGGVCAVAGVLLMLSVRHRLRHPTPKA